MAEGQIILMVGKKPPACLRLPSLRTARRRTHCFAKLVPTHDKALLILSYLNFSDRQTWLVGKKKIPVCFLRK